MLGPQIVEKIKDTLALDGTHRFEDVVAMLESGEAQIFHNPHGCWITTLQVAPLAKILHVWIIAGELPGVVELQPEVVKFAREHGCTKLTSCGRPGWSRKIAQNHGWRIANVQTVLDL